MTCDHQIRNRGVCVGGGDTFFCDRNTSATQDSSSPIYCLCLPRLAVPCPARRLCLDPSSPQTCRACLALPCLIGIPGFLVAADLPNLPCLALPCTPGIPGILVAADLPNLPCLALPTWYSWMLSSAPACLTCLALLTWHSEVSRRRRLA